MAATPCSTGATGARVGTLFILFFLFFNINSKHVNIKYHETGQKILSK
jgi:hypothetical protein